jgi:hypothetical protein
MGGHSRRDRMRQSGDVNPFLLGKCRFDKRCRARHSEASAQLAEDRDHVSHEILGIDLVERRSLAKRTQTTRFW